MNRILKKTLSMILACVMLVSMVPASVFTVHAAEVTDPTAAAVGDTTTIKGSTAKPADSSVEGTHWAGPVKSADMTCGKDYEHTHSDACYTTPNVTACAHFLESTLLGHPDTCTIANLNDPCTKRICFSSHKTVDGTKYHVKFECQHTHTKGCYTLGCDYALKGEHTHDDTACYSYTWTLVWNEYDVSVSFEGNTVSVTAVDVPAKGTHSKDVTFKLSATGDAYNTWTAKIGDKAYVLSATEPTTVVAYGITSGEIKVTLTSEAVPTYSVSLEQNSLAGCTATFVGDHANLLPGAEVVVNVTTPANTSAVIYSYTVEVTGATYTKEDNKITVVVGASDASVKITYSIKKIGVNANPDTVEMNPGKPLVDENGNSVQLDALKQAIFNAVVNSGAAIPNGITVNDVDFHYYQYHVGLSLSDFTTEGFNAGMKLLGSPASDDDTSMNPHTYYAFGERFATAGEQSKKDNVEKVRITGKSGTAWAGLYVEAEITLVHNNHEYSAVVTTPDCINGGYTTYTCACGESYVADQTAPTGHTPGPVATCTNDQVCDTCGEVLVESKGHIPGAATVENNVPANCGNAGSYDSVVYCSVENCRTELSRDTVPVPATGNHNYQQTGHEDATCTENGYTSYECTVCNNAYSDTHTAPGHTEGEVQIENNTGASCAKDGSFDEVVYCSVCDEELSRKTTTVPATGEHRYLNEKERVSASCTVDGYVIMACACGAEQKTTLTAPGHKESEAVRENVSDASCYAEGSYDAVVYCSVCDAELSRTKKTIEKKAHSPATPVAENNVAPSCTEAGSYDSVVYCSVAECHFEISRENKPVAATGHTPVIDLAVAATCEDSGLTQGSHCGVCGETIVGQEKVPALGHAYTYQVNADGTHTAICGNNSVHNYTEAHNTDYDVCICGKLHAGNGTIAINKYYTASGDAKALDNLRKNVLVAAGLNPELPYAVTTEIGLRSQLGNITTVVQINANGVVLLDKTAEAIVNLLGGADKAFTMLLDNDTGRTFTLVLDAHGEYPKATAEVTMTIVDAREAATVTHNDTKYNAPTLDGVNLDKVQANLTSNAVISGIEWKDSTAEMVPGQYNTVAVRVKLLASETIRVENDGWYEVEISVFAPYTKAEISVPSTGEMNYNTSMTDFNKAENVWDALNPQFTPAGGTYTYEVFYLANVARDVDMVINFGQMDLGMYSSIIKRVLGDSVTIQIPVKDKWLNIGEEIALPEAPSNELIQKILMEDLIPNYGTQFLAGNLSSERMKEILVETLKKYPAIAEYYEYLGAHYFGDNEQKDANGNVLETVYVQVYNYTVDGNNLGDLGSETATRSVLALTDDRAEVEIKLNTGVAVVYGSYTEEQLMALILDGVYANGQKINGLPVEFITSVLNLPASEDGCVVEVKFAGNKEYKKATASTVIMIAKAPVEVSIDNRLVKWQEGQFYGINDVVITNPAGVETINFIAGLNLSGVNLDSGVKGFVAQVQLMLPEDLQSMLESADGLLKAAGLNVSFGDGASMKLSELKTAVDALDGIMKGSEYEEYFRILLNMLSSLPTEVADVEIIIGGTVPTDIGAYIIGAVSADANYETSFGVGAIVIYPDGTKVDLAWNQNDDNYIITNTLLSTGAFDAGAHAIKVYDDRYTLEQATAQVGEIFLGVDIDGNITFEMDPAKLNVGAYVEIALIVNWGNEMFYSEPLVRPIVVVAESLDIDFVDASGNVNNDRHFEFFNVPQNGMEGHLKVSYKKDGTPFIGNYEVTYYYVGVQTNGQPYASKTAPTHAGVYTITAIVVVRDNTGYITHAGQGVGALVIEPSKSTTDVENEAVKWDGAETTVNQFVNAGSVNVPGLYVDTTIISAGIHANLDTNIGLDAVKGSVNVDMPRWLDDLMKKYDILQAGFGAGITADTFLGYAQMVENAIAELGIENDAFAKIVNVIAQLPSKTVLTFHDNKGYSEVGAYLVIGIVTDSDHYLSADAGIMVIYPNAEKVDLQFAKTWDDNNVFTQKYLQSYDLNAQAYLNGKFNESLTEKALNLFVGFADHGELILTNHKANLDNGVYAQVSFLLVLDNVMYYAEPIAREVIILPNNANIDFIDVTGNVNNDRHFEFDAQPHAMNSIRVTLVDGTVLDLTLSAEGVEIFYAGVQSNGKPYASYNAPVNAGVYEVTVQYTERDAQGRVIHLGIGVGVMVIEPSKSEVSVDSDMHQFGGDYAIDGMVHASSNNVPGLTPDTTIISAGLSANLDNLTGLNAINGTVNIDLPAWMDRVMNEMNILDAGYADGISANVFLSYVEKIRAGFVEMGVEIEAFNKIVALIEQMPITTKLTFSDDISYTENGAYLVVAVVTDFNHYPSVDAGVMVIYPKVEKAELKWFYNDTNGIITLPALNAIDMSAVAYMDGTYSQADTEKIAYLTVGVSEEGSLIVTTATNGIKSNGMYTQVAYIPFLVGTEISVAQPIMRSFAVVPQTVDVEVADTNVACGEQYEILVSVDGSAENVQLVFIDLLTGYYSTVAPTKVGSYTVVATYTERVDGEVARFGMSAGRLVIAGHTAGEIVRENETDADCVNDGHYDNVVYCVGCNCELSRETISVPAKGHTEGEAVMENVVGATCGAAGSYDMVVYCTVCGEELSRNAHATDKLPHTSVIDAAVAPSCTETGLTAGEHCSVCDEILVPQETVDALGHDMQVVKELESTCFEAGYVWEECKNGCGYEHNYEVGEILDHEFVDGNCRFCEMADPDCEHAETYTYTVLPSCVKEGSVKTFCKRCDTKLSEETLEKDTVNGHAFYNGYCLLCKCCQHLTTRVEETPATCTKEGVRKTICSQEDGCGQVIAEEPIATIAHDYEAVVTKPTCTEGGYTTYTCSVCDDSYVGDKVDALGHDYEAVVTKPTCTEGGYTTYTCSVCDDSYVGDKVDALGHEYVAVVTKPTCTKEGYTTYTCSACSDSYVGDEVPAKGHNYTAAVTEPTCTKEGYTTYTCSGCGSSYVSNRVAALGHSFQNGKCTVCGETDPNYNPGGPVEPPAHVHNIEVVPGVAPTCTTTGLTEGSACTRCGVTLKAQEEIPALGHTEETIAAVNATCDASGLTEGKKCSTCDVILTAQEVVPALGHNYESTVTEPTCDAEGYTMHTCANCGHSYKDEMTAKREHRWNDSEVVVSPTCAVPGSKRMTCAYNDCNAYVDEETPALGHSEVVLPAVEATCTTSGLTEGKKCSACDEILVAQEEIAAKGHNFGEWTVTKEATKKAPGEKTRSCACGEAETCEIPVLEGSNVGLIIVVVIGGVSLLGVLAYFFLKKKKTV